MAQFAVLHIEEANQHRFFIMQLRLLEDKDTLVKEWRLWQGYAMSYGNYRKLTQESNTICFLSPTGHRSFPGLIGSEEHGRNSCVLQGAKDARLGKQDCSSESTVSFDRGLSAAVVLRVADGKQITGTVCAIVKEENGVRRMAVGFEYNGKPLVADFLEPVLGAEDNCKAARVIEHRDGPDTILYGLNPADINYDN